MSKPDAKHILITGPPGIGKTTLIKKICSSLKQKNIPVKGFYTEELRNDLQKRIGFDIVTLDGKRERLSRTFDYLRKGDSRSNKLGQYFVFPEAFGAIVEPIFAEMNIGVLVIDEIGKMELFSSNFEELVKGAFEKPNLCILATVPVLKGRLPLVESLIGDTTNKLITVTQSNRNSLVNDILPYLTMRYFTTEPQTQDAKQVETEGHASDEKKSRKSKNGDKKKFVTKKQSARKKLPNPNPNYPGRLPIPKDILDKHSRGSGINKTGIKTKFYRKKQNYKESNIKFAHDLAARTEILLTEDSGVLEADVGETTTQFTQKDIVKNVDITAATKHFELSLRDFGPYRIDYTRNGRHLALGGKLGHVATFDWFTKKLHFEINVMESVHDITWLHIETMLAVAQKDWVYIYDNQGIELHCLKVLNKVTRMQFLPYHFLLATANDEGYLSWLDVSIGQIVVQYNSRLGRINMMAQNPYNAVLCVGGSKGLVSMWTPNTREPVAKMLCHKSAMSSLHIDPKGMYMATAGNDRSLKIWDIRKLEGPLQHYQLKSVANNIALSQKNMLAVGMGNIVEVYRDCCTQTANRPYLRHRLNNSVVNISFCPYEDVLGVGSEKGFTSLLAPGSGEPNFDAYEANPFQTKSQRKEAEVKSLLEKIPSALISLDPSKISEVDVPTLQEKVEATKKLLFVKPPKINYEPRRKARGKGGSVKIAKNKKLLQEQAAKEHGNIVKTVKDQLMQKDKKTNRRVKQKTNILDRFLPKQKNK
ncbi:hypothetical protein FQR65_LT11511 [Abscondita terminalis]|nr:hypothetical protein FQR65_LT11511 [Abscondita terminalis]